MKSIEDLIKFRRHVHRNPELSGMERRTAALVAENLESLGADKVIQGLGGYGVAAVFKSENHGPRILLRAELDALPITETGDLEHKSENVGIGHLCGHDGHMTILLGVASKLADDPPTEGEVVLLFQPAEETGQGAYQVINDPAFSEIDPDLAIALHNLPSYPENEILLRAGTFACASRGVIMNLRGKTSHAAHPEQGISPAMAVADLIKTVEKLPGEADYKEFVLATLIHTRIGEVAFGTSPGEATVMATLRSASEDDMAEMVSILTSQLAGIAEKYQLSHDISFTEIFPATVNDPAMLGLVEENSKKLGLESTHIELPFRWSEDFGHFGARCPAVLFGVGSGTDHPALHNPDYDFNDELIGPTLALMTSLAKEAGKILIDKT